MRFRRQACAVQRDLMYTSLNAPGLWTGKCFREERPLPPFATTLFELLQLHSLNLRFRLSDKVSRPVHVFRLVAFKEAALSHFGHPNIVVASTFL